MRRKGRFRAALLLSAGLIVLLLFLGAVSNLQEGRREEGRQQLERALRRAALACYATEGFYPPTLEYMQDHYGVQINEELYIVHYMVEAENMMPDITVLERNDEK